MARLPYFSLLTSSLLFLTSCSPATPTAAAEIITVQYTAAAAPWLVNLYDCAGENTILVEQRAADYFDPNMKLAIRIGEPINLDSPAYQIGTEDILVIVNPLNPINRLDGDQVRDLFSGQIQNWKDINGTEAAAQVWVFTPSEDVQQIFEQIALRGAPITSLARLAAGPEEMAQAIVSDVNAIGILSRDWITANVASVFTAASVPVLAIPPAEPQGALAELLACLQK